MLTLDQSFILQILQRSPVLTSQTHKTSSLKNSWLLKSKSCPCNQFTHDSSTSYSCIMAYPINFNNDKCSTYRLLFPLSSKQHCKYYIQCHGITLSMGYQLGTDMTSHKHFNHDLLRCTYSTYAMSTLYPQTHTQPSTLLKSWQ